MPEPTEVPMRLVISAAIALAALWPLRSEAVTDENFVVRTTRDLVSLCTTPQDDPHYLQAVNFCQGYVVGAYHYYLASISGPGAKPMVCPPDPPPSRNAGIGEFVKWANSRPEYMNARPVDALFKFLVEKWPCQR
jgi:hypothetical protein